jgi:hypothetical protein
MHPCLNCPYRIGDNFCKLLSWNDTTLPTPLDKYIAWQGVPCLHINDPQQLPLPVPQEETGLDDRDRAERGARPTPLRAT